MLVHQTFRLTSIIEDLLMLSRLESGRMELALSPVDLTHVVDTCVDDLRLSQVGAAVDVQIDVPPALHIAGDKRYAMLIVGNLVENARKYSSPGAPIRIEAKTTTDSVSLLVANKAKPIPRAAWEHIFERFHRGTMGENVPGHGLGLNLARELARLFGGDVVLLRSDEEWTEFEVRFRHPQPSPAATLAVA